MEMVIKLFAKIICYSLVSKWMVKQKIKDAKWKWWERRHKKVLDEIFYTKSSKSLPSFKGFLNVKAENTVETIKEELPFTIPSPISAAAVINAMYSARGLGQLESLYQNQMLSAHGQQLAFNQGLIGQQQQFQEMLGQQTLLHNQYHGSVCGDSLGVSGIISGDYGKK